MKLKIQNLQKAKTLLNSVIDDRARLPILTYVMIFPDKISATNLDLSVYIPIETEWLDDNRKPFIMEWKILQCIITEGINIIEIKLDSIIWNGTEIKNKEDVKNYPQFTQYDMSESEIIKMNGQNFKDVVFASANDNSRPVLASVFFDKENECLVATDSYRLQLSKDLVIASSPLKRKAPANSSNSEIADLKAQIEELKSQLNNQSSAIEKPHSDDSTSEFVEEEGFLEPEEINYDEIDEVLEKEIENTLPVVEWFESKGKMYEYMNFTLFSGNNFTRENFLKQKDILKECLGTTTTWFAKGFCFGIRKDIYSLQIKENLLEHFTLRERRA